MSNRQIQYLMKNPQRMMRFQATGRLPAEYTATSPLIRCLMRYTPRQRLQMRGIWIHPDLGYIGNFRFANGEQLLNWLRPRPTMIEGESWPADSRRDKRFHSEISEEVLKRHVDRWDL